MKIGRRIRRPAGDVFPRVCVDSTVEANKFNYDLSFLACGVQIFGEYPNLLFDCLSPNELISVSLLCHMLRSVLVKE